MLRWKYPLEWEILVGSLKPNFSASKMPDVAQRTDLPVRSTMSCRTSSCTSSCLCSNMQTAWTKLPICLLFKAVIKDCCSFPPFTLLFPDWFHFHRWNARLAACQLPSPWEELGGSVGPCHAVSCVFFVTVSRAHQTERKIIFFCDLSVLDLSLNPCFLEMQTVYNVN